jgi:hypothetical protein
MSSYSSSSQVPAAAAAAKEAAGVEGDADSDDELAGDEWAQRHGAVPVKPAAGAASHSATPTRARQTSQAMQPMLKCGWLEKRSITSGMISWKPLWHVLRGSLLAWHVDSDAARRGDMMGAIDLLAVDIVTEVVADEPDPLKKLSGRTFGLQQQGESLQAFRAAAPNDKQLWISNLQKAKASSERSTSGPSSASPSGLPRTISAGLNKEQLSARFHHDELCYSCRKQFNVVRRRHHCRRCMHSFCDS